ncbi:rhsC in rhs element domain protein [Escherichia coli DEC15C]|nr:rhsC in rhs element domain protein [Escherichia coli DEC15C]
MWRRERDLTGWMSLSRKPQVTWYGWDGDRLTTIQNDRTRIQTIYQPGSFTPLIRVETATGELAKTQRRSLADRASAVRRRRRWQCRCSRRCWCRCSTGWKVKSWLTG